MQPDHICIFTATQDKSSVANPMNQESNEITELKRTVWRTAISRRVERFSLLLDNKTIASQYFGEKYIEALTIKIDQITRKLLFLGIAYSILMLSLFAAQDSVKTEFEFFGYGFKNLSYHKEILLLLAATLSPISTTLSGYKNYLVALRAECLKRIAPASEVRDFYSNVHVDNYFEALMKPYDYRSSSPHFATTSLAALFIGILILVILTIVAGSFLLQFSVIYDVATKPSTSRLMNIMVIGYTIAAILLSWTIALMQLPLPELDLTNFHRLTALKISDPEKYESTMASIVRESSRREDAWSLSLGFIASVVTVAVMSVLIMEHSSGAIDQSLNQGLFAVFVSLLVAKPIADSFKRFATRWFFQTYPAATSDRLHRFGVFKRVMLTARVVTPTLIAGLTVLIQYLGR